MKRSLRRFSLRAACVLTALLLILAARACVDKNDYTGPEAGIIFSLNDTLVEPVTYTSTGRIGVYELKIDADSVPDIIFKVEEFQLGREYTKYCEVSPGDGYVLFIQNGTQHTFSEYEGPDTIFVNSSSKPVKIPRILGRNDTIPANSSFTALPLKLTYHEDNRFQLQSWTTTISNWISMDEKYIGLYNSENEILVWVKISVPGYNSLILHSCCFVEHSEYQVVDEVENGRE
ncbi:MAG: hypothetical protein ACOYXB_12930 [Bacteroidota bacterium]